MWPVNETFFREILLQVCNLLFFIGCYSAFLLNFEIWIENWDLYRRCHWYPWCMYLRTLKNSMYQSLDVTFIVIFSTVPADDEWGLQLEQKFHDNFGCNVGNTLAYPSTFDEWQGLDFFQQLIHSHKVPCLYISHRVDEHYCGNCIDSSAFQKIQGRPCIWSIASFRWYFQEIRV